MRATIVAIIAAPRAATGIMIPNIPMLVNVAKRPPAGVKPPYATDWKAAASVPVVTRVYWSAI